MSFDEIVLQALRERPRATVAELAEDFRKKIDSSLSRLRAEDKIETEDGVKGYPFRYKLKTGPVRRL